MFKDVVGQYEIKQRLLRSARDGFVPHAQLFCGASGAGKYPLALAYAQYLNCENPQAEDACGECASCLKYNRLAHPDLHFVFPIVKKTSPKMEVSDDYVSQWRQMLNRSPYFAYDQWLAEMDAENSQAQIFVRESEEVIRKLNLKIYEGKYKVMLVWLPEKFRQDTANKLLKIIEEPTPNTVFLLVSDAPEMILPTIQSRCQRINIPPLPKEEIAEALMQRFSLDETTANEVAHVANGSFTKALAILTNSEEQRYFLELFKGMMRASYSRNIKTIRAIADELSKIGRERQKNFLEYSRQMIREYFVSNVRRPELVYLNREEQEFGIKFSPFINERNIVDFAEELEVASIHIEQNVNAKMVFFDLCLKITLLIKR